MKKFILFILIFCAFLAACSNYADNRYTWNIISKNNRDVIVKGEQIESIKNDIRELIFHLNESNMDPVIFSNQLNTNNASQFPPKIQFIGIEDKTIKIRIINEDYLTQQMGSTGAEDFLARVTYTLTENPNIEVVDFVFTEGDHATPGKYTRNSFKDLVKDN